MADTADRQVRVYLIEESNAMPTYIGSFGEEGQTDGMFEYPNGVATDKRVVPFVLGFHPTKSIMVLCLTDRRLGLMQRLDLPPLEQAHAVGSVLLPTLVKENPDGVILIGFESSVDESLPALEALTTAVHRLGIPIHERIVVRDGTWRSLDCLNPTCCPPEGSPVPHPADASRVVSEFVGQGMAPHADRESLAQQLEPGPQSVTVADVIRSRQKARAKAGDCVAIPRAELFAAWPRILNPDGQAASAEDAAMAAVSLLDIEIRDGLVAWLCPGTLDLGQLSEKVQELLSSLQNDWDKQNIDPSTTEAQNAIQEALIRPCAMLPDDAAAPAVTVLASFVWWRGDGALARVALARALRCDPDYRLARLLLQMVDLGIRPGVH